MKLKKILSMVVFLAIIIMTCGNVKALELNQIEPVLSTSHEGTKDIVVLTQRIVNIVSYIGGALSVIVIAVLGIKYMTGSVEEKAQYKKTLVPYAVGCIVIFSGSVIVQTVYTMITSINGKIV